MEPWGDEGEEGGLPTPYSLIADEIASIRAAIGDEVPESAIVKALTAAGNNPDRALNLLLDSPELAATANGDFSSPVEIEVVSELLIKSCSGENLSSFEHGVVVKKEELGMDVDDKSLILVPETIRVKKEEQDMVVDDQNLILSAETRVKREDEPKTGSDQPIELEEEICANSSLLESNTAVRNRKQEMGAKKDVFSVPEIRAKKEDTSIIISKKEALEEYEEVLAESHCAPYLNPRPIRAIAPGEVTDRRIQVVSKPDEAELGEFPVEHDWYLVGNTYVGGLSTCRGRGKIDANEIVYFTFPKNGWKKIGRKVVSLHSGIVRFSTKRSGEIGRLPPEWSSMLIPLVETSKVKVRARCVVSPAELSLMKEIMLYVSLYINRTIFTKADNSSWNLESPSPVDPSVCPLPSLFRFLNLKPFQKAEFTPEELDSRKRSLNLRDSSDDDDGQIVGLAKRRRGGETYAEQSNDEQAISEASLNKLVGTAEVYNLEEAEPPSTLLCSLWPYQKEALYWMSELEKGLDVGQAQKTLHPCWAAYNVSDKRAPAMYVNIFSGQVTTQFPSAIQMTRGGILADAMGLGKTVMTIALVLSKPRGRSDDLMENPEPELKRVPRSRSPSSVKGGTLIVCPMALLGQWKDELETHSQPGSISVFVHYGGDRTNDPREIAKYHVVLTTYGVLQSSFKSGGETGSIFHRIDWYRVVLDEAHTIKSPKAQVSQSAFALNSHCRWCLTGTPLQNNLEDPYSLLCFLHVQPWCNWAWWQKLIQGPYENGDERGLRLIKAILRPLMLRRTKETKDKFGRPILVLPPANVQIVECEQSEAERDFYNALFWKSKVKFDQFVAQGKVLHNYASILELLLRLRQCCNHPYLDVSRKDTEEYTDLNKLAHRFLDGSLSSSAPTKAYVEVVIDGIRRGEVSECPICLESASDDPVLTPCAHRMCRECLLASWFSPAGGPCPICRKKLTKADLITCPTDNKFQVDIHKNWKESSKIQELFLCLESIRSSGSGEKSIVFSQWTSFLDLLEIPLGRKGFGYLRFDGKLNQKNRERILKEFNERQDKPVLLMSLKAGGVGLNLTAASNVFLMDPWWNPAVEEQAIMRIHRIGQKRQVRVRRFIVKGTVEERMQQVQARKQRMIAGALTDDEVRTARIEELKMLFK